MSLIPDIDNTRWTAAKVRDNIDVGRRVEKVRARTRREVAALVAFNPTPLMHVGSECERIRTDFLPAREDL
ncbi:MAG: hypothetical protein QXO66_04085, partial [Thermofilum sp.]